MKIEDLKAKIYLEYNDEIDKAFSLLPGITDNEVVKKIPAICLAGEENGLINLFLENFLERIESGSEKPVHYQAIYNSNDYLEIGGTDDVIKIEEVRDLISFAAYKKESLGYKYIVVKNIEKANVYSMNSLLKLIEEPSENTIFICTTVSFTSLLSTIKSRLFCIQLPVRLKLTDFSDKNTDEFEWISEGSFEILQLASELRYSEQKSVLASIREKNIRELFDEFSVLCLEEHQLSVDGILLGNKILKKLYAMCIVECLLFSNSSSEYRKVILSASEFLKGANTSFGNTFFKELFYLTEKVLYSIFKASHLMLNNRCTYTWLTIKLLENDLNFDNKNLLDFIKFLERIKNSVQINCNRELLLYNYLIGMKKLLK